MVDINTLITVLLYSYQIYCDSVVPDQKKKKKNSHVSDYGLWAAGLQKAL